ncbi:helix-turn-helix domain-containing protein [Neoroseomonas oryzicola]|uniref:Helix-turn-helix domain-containing protein n=2 Tax=Neoroseomonas oryzicola TaxID=535904 RepID=A0ABX1EQH4_9PROT|nr:helix-turn-helix domain-containing protein [Neoroseomonas oryzicola]NKE20110.1 helix-turn-helix domain-containing protein [Neoroseomonas oryzicola]
MKRTPRPDLTAAEAARVGEDLREARLTLGASVEDMAERLRINRRYIHALEEGRIKDLPGPAYAVGFVRSYAAALGLDPDEAVRRFRDVTGGAATKNGELVFPEPVPSRGVPAGALVAVGAVLAVGAYVAWYNWSGSGNRVVDAVPPVPARLDPAVPEAQRPREAAAPGAPGTPTQAAAAPAGPAAVTQPAQPAPTPAAAPVPPGMAGVVLRARGETWVQVRDSRQNQTVLDRVLRTGDTYQVPAREGMVLTTGKAENLDVLLDGQVVAVLVGATGVRRAVPLDTDRLRAAGPAPAAAAPAAAPAAPAPAAAAPQQPRPAAPDAAPRPPANQGARP